MRTDKTGITAKTHRKERLYIAYGSNLSLSQMAGRCPTAEVVGTATLRGWRLMFRKVATIERCAGYTVPVLIWRLQPQDERALDRYEGWPHLYRKEILKVTLNGKRQNAMAYIMNEDAHPYSPPEKLYMQTILGGYGDFGFDPGILYRAAGESITAGLNIADVGKEKGWKGGAGK